MLETSAKMEVAYELVQQMLKDVIEPSDSPWASPIVLVTKKDRSIRFGDTLNTFDGAEYFCTMDLASRYCQVRIKKEDKPITAFATRKDLVQFKVMSFGLTNAPASFQRLMCTVPTQNGDGSVEGSRVQAKSKRQWFKCSVKYLGHVVFTRSIECDTDKLQAVKDWPVPRSVAQIRQFLGFAAFYGKFISHFSEIAQPLANLTNVSKTLLGWKVSACLLDSEAASGYGFYFGLPQ